MLGKLKLMAVLPLVNTLVQLAANQPRYMGRTTMALYQNRATPYSRLRVEATLCSPRLEETICSLKLEATLYSPRLRAIICSPRLQGVVETRCSKARWSSLVFVQYPQDNSNALCSLRISQVCNFKAL